MSGKHWHNGLSPYEKILLYGPQQLTEQELLAVLLRSGSRGKSALTLAQDLIAKHGNLALLIDTPRSIFTKNKGVGDTKYLTLQVAVEIGKRYLQAKYKGRVKLNTIEKATEYLKLHMTANLNEVFSCVFLKNNLEVIAFDELFFGTINATNVYPREILRRALQYNAAKIILTHNHPSGTAKPSSADQTTTIIIEEALKMIDVEVVDHIILAPHSSFSFKSQGLL